MGALFDPPKAPAAPPAPPPPPTLSASAVQGAAANQVRSGAAAAGEFGAAGTVLTGPQGLVTPPTTSNKALFGS